MDKQSLRALLGELPKCQHITPVPDSFDAARGEHLCFNVATRRVTPLGRSVQVSSPKKLFCDLHAEGQVVHGDLPWAAAYRKLVEQL